MRLKDAHTTESSPPASVSDAYDYGNVPHLPAEIIVSILQYQSFGDLFFRARLVNRIWYAVAMHQARQVLARWISTLEQFVPGDLEIQYHGNNSKVHRNRHLRCAYTKLHPLQRPGVSMEFKVTNHQFNEEIEQNVFAPLVQTLEVYLSSDPWAWRSQDKELVGQTDLRLCLTFQSSVERPPQNGRWSRYERRHFVQELKVKGIYLEKGSSRRNARLKRLALTMNMMECFNIEFEFRGNFAREEGFCRYYRERKTYGRIRSEYSGRLEVMLEPPK